MSEKKQNPYTMQAELVQQVGDLISEWRKTCSTMGLRWRDKDAAEFIAAGLDGYVSPSVFAACVAEARSRADAAEKERDVALKHREVFRQALDARSVGTGLEHLAGEVERLHYLLMDAIGQGYDVPDYPLSRTGKSD